MKVTLESTTKIVELVINGQAVPARIWEGTTDSGIPCHAYVTRIAVAPDLDASQFERELRECRRPTPAIAAIPAPAHSLNPSTRRNRRSDDGTQT